MARSAAPPATMSPTAAARIKQVIPAFVLMKIHFSHISSRIRFAQSTLKVTARQHRRNCLDACGASTVPLAEGQVVRLIE